MKSGLSVGVDLRSDDEGPQCGQHMDWDSVDLRQDLQNSANLVFAEAGEWPYMCTVFRTSNVKGCTRTLSYICGASLISVDTVLTTWHNIK